MRFASHETRRDFANSLHAAVTVKTPAAAFKTHPQGIGNLLRHTMEGSTMAEVPRLLMLIGAATPPGRLAAAIAAVAEALRGGAGDIDVDVMNLAETSIDTCDGRPLDEYGGESREAADRIAAAAAVLIAAPVYRASFPGVLKNLLDIVPVEALQGKPVGIVAMGGSAHHYLAIDTQLRQVLGWFGALVAPTSVYLTGADFRDGALKSQSASKDLAALADTLLRLLRRLVKIASEVLPGLLDLAIEVQAGCQAGIGKHCPKTSPPCRRSALA
jgi:FMN reductase